MQVRDYAKRPRSSRQRKRGNPLLFPFVLISLIGLVSAGAYLIKGHSETHKKTLTEKKAASVPIHREIAVTRNHKKRKAKEATLTTEPRSATEFDFYTLLPKMEVAVPQPKANAIHTRAETYLLQVAAVKDLQDAKRLRDKLQAMGLMASVQSYRSNSTGTVWNRVITGPYSNLKAAEDDQDTLLDQHIDSLLLRIKGTS